MHAATTNTKSTSYASIALVQCLTAVQNHMATQYNSARKVETPNRPYDAVCDMFRRYFDSLVTAIEPVYLNVANKLFADGWINRPFEAVPGETSKQAASRIVGEVERQLK